MGSDETWGWKGIASHLEVSVNHAKKLYEEEDLPVRKIGQGKKPRYFAKTSELAKWKEQAGLAGLPKAGGPSPTAAPATPEGKAGLEVAVVPGSEQTGRSGFASRRRTLLFLAACSALTILVIVLQGPELYLDFESTPGEARLKDRRTGEDLWNEPLVGGTATNTRLARVDPWGEVLLHVPESKDYQIAEARELLVLEPYGKEVLRTVTIDTEDCEKVFPSYSSYYRVRLNVDDIDNDGSDEVFVSYNQVPNFPACTVLYEPALDRHRSLYASLGHHFYQGSWDLDRDGLPEAIFGSIANKMAWYRGVAAVTLNPAVGEGNTTTALALSPDIDRPGFGGANLYWFALTSAPNCASEGSCMSVDAESQAVTFGDNPELTLTFDGFSPASSSALAGPWRRVLRRKIHASLRDAKRYSRLGLSETAPPNLAESLEAARRVGDANLESIVQVRRVELLIALGSFDEANRLARELSSNYGNFAVNMAYEVGLAFQLHRQLDEAIFWYAFGFGSGAPSLAHERPRGELLRNMVLAYAQRLDFEGALSAISRFEPYVDEDWAERLRRFASFRARETNAISDLGPDIADEDSYWALERLFETQDPTPEFMQHLEDARKRNSEARSLVLILYAEALLAQGLPEGALEEIKVAEPLLYSQSREFVAVATDLEIAERRIARIKASAASLRSSH